MAAPGMSTLPASEQLPQGKRAASSAASVLSGPGESIATSALDATVVGLSPASRATRSWSPALSAQLYAVAGWSTGLVSLSDAGTLRVHPLAERGPAIDLAELVSRLRAQGLHPPLVLRFPDVVRTQIRRLRSHFAAARARHAYRGPFHGCFPVKSCHDVDVVRAVVGEGVRDPLDAPYGLEVGSKAELALAIARFGERAAEARANARKEQTGGRTGAADPSGAGRSPADPSPADPSADPSQSSLRDGRFMIVCNGRKDARYVRLACLASALGAKVVLIVESGEELEGTLDVIDAAAAEFAAQGQSVHGGGEERLRGAAVGSASSAGFGPLLGLRARLDGRHPGRFGASSGPGAKFGLGPAALLRALDLLRSRDALWRLTLLHYHAGSQAAAVSAVRASAREASRVYCELAALGAPLDTLDVGGGLAVAYDGTGSAEDASTAYSLAEYADAVVDEIGRAVDEAGLPHPRIVAEAGRAVAIHHAVTVVDVLDGNRAFAVGGGHGRDGAIATAAPLSAPAASAAPAPSFAHLSARPGEASYSTLTSVCPLAPPAPAASPAPAAEAPAALSPADRALLEVVADAVAALRDEGSAALLGEEGREAVRGILEALVDLGVPQARLDRAGSGAARPPKPHPSRSTSSDGSAPQSLTPPGAERASSHDAHAAPATALSCAPPASAEALSRAAERAGSLRVSCVRSFERRAATLRARALCDEMAWAAGARAREGAERFEAARLARRGGDDAEGDGDGAAAAPGACAPGAIPALPPCAPPPWAHLNLNVFRSLADAWGMGQIFPIVPLDSLDLEPSQRVALADLTCDSEGKVARFARPGILPCAIEEDEAAEAARGGRDPARALSLSSLLPDALADGGCSSLRIHPPAVRAARREPYALGIFMTGVYQDVLGGPHNMLGAPNSVAVECVRPGEGVDADNPKRAGAGEGDAAAPAGSSASGYRIVTVRRGETVAQVLDGQGHCRAELERGIRSLVRAAGDVNGDALVDAYERVLDEYTYLHM